MTLRSAPFLPFGIGVAEEIEVLQNVLIFAVEVDGSDVRVDIYGSDEQICGTVTYTFADRGVRKAQAATLAQWCETSVPLTYVKRADTVALLDESALFTAALE
jgi:hypothetical protein